jgi:23S rRNA U2552 (ribose-2'-O)-methylase RlmE/FtsJ
MDNTPHWLEPVAPQVTSPAQNPTVGTGTLILQTTLHDQVLATKNEIDRIAPVGHWDDAKKITNTYEYIFLSLLRRQHQSMAAIAPLSRSYFKMIELWDLFGLTAPSATVHVAEGPGGFLEAIQDRTAHRTPMIAMTLRSSERTIPGWRKSQQFLTNHPSVKVTYGADGTGNLYNLPNQDAFVAAAPTPAQIFTADGGFDFSADFNGQENTVQRLLIAEAYAGLRTLAAGGTMIIKLFDTKQRATLEFLWILSVCFEKTALVKPQTSRPANSERYWVGQGYRGAPEWVLTLFRTLTATDAPSGWNQLFADEPWTPTWLESVKTFQERLEATQLNKIQLTLNLIRAPARDVIVRLLTENIQNSRVWCRTHAVPVNQRYQALSDEEIVSQNLEEALAPFQASVGRTGLPAQSRPQPMPRALCCGPAPPPPAGGAWRSALPPSILSYKASRTDEGIPPSDSPPRSQSPPA